MKKQKIGEEYYLLNQENANSRLLSTNSESLNSLILLSTLMTLTRFQ